jgi:hypothetical protein
MTLLAPWQALTAAAIAFPLVVLFYMLKLRRRPARVSTAMFWVSAAKDLEANVPFRWLKASWLLFLQLLVVALLVLAIGRPAIPTQVPLAQRLVIIMDRTASTSARTTSASPGDQSPVFEQIRQGVLDRIDSLSRQGFDGQATLLLLDAAPAIAAGPTADLQELRAAVLSVPGTDQPGDLKAALRLAQTITQPLEPTGSENTQESGETPIASTRTSLIELYTDGAFAITPTSEADLRQVMVRQIGLESPSITGGLTPSGNAGIVTLAARRDIDDPALIRLLVAVVAEAPLPLTLPLAISIDGVRESTRPLELAEDTDTPGLLRGTLTYPLRMPEGGLIEVSIERPDVLPSDNLAGVRITPPPAPSIVIVQQDRNELNSDASWVLVETLKALGPRALVAMTAEEFAARGVPQSTDLLILDGATTPAQTTVPTLFMGIDPGFQGLEVSTVTPTSESFVSWQRRHPIWRGTAIDSIRWNTAIEFQSGTDSGVIATGPAGPVVVLDERGGQRRLALSFRPVESTWPTHHSFALFLANAVEFLTMRGQLEAGAVLTTAEPAVITSLDLNGATRGQLVGPSGVTVSFETTADGSVRTGQFDRAGRYTIQTPQGNAGAVVVGVLNEQESLLIPTMQSTADGPTENQLENVEGIRVEAVEEIWWWLVIPACALLLAEWLLYAWRARV